MNLATQSPRASLLEFVQTKTKDSEKVCICQDYLTLRVAMTSSSSPSGSGGNSMTDTGNIWSKEIKQLEDNIRKSTEDERAYRAIELRNGMKMLIISDPTTDKAAACLNVRIGFVTDPDYLPGLAHFCEHMLFLGTKKFPEENYFEKFVHEHGGKPVYCILPR